MTVALANCLPHSCHSRLGTMVSNTAAIWRTASPGFDQERSLHQHADFEHAKPVRVHCAGGRLFVKEAHSSEIDGGLPVDAPDITGGLAHKYLTAFTESYVEGKLFPLSLRLLRLLMLLAAATSRYCNAFSCFPARRSCSASLCQERKNSEYWAIES